MGEPVAVKEILLTADQWFGFRRGERHEWDTVLLEEVPELLAHDALVVDKDGDRICKVDVARKTFWYSKHATRSVDGMTVIAMRPGGQNKVQGLADSWYGLVLRSTRPTPVSHEDMAAAMKILGLPVPDNPDAWLDTCDRCGRPGQTHVGHYVEHGFEGLCGDCLTFLQRAKRA